MNGPTRKLPYWEMDTLCSHGKIRRCQIIKHFFFFVHTYVENKPGLPKGRNAKTDLQVNIFVLWPERPWCNANSKMQQLPNYAWKYLSCNHSHFCQNEPQKWPKIIRSLQTLTPCDEKMIQCCKCIASSAVEQTQNYRTSNFELALIDLRTSQTRVNHPKIEHRTSEHLPKSWESPNGVWQTPPMFWLKIHKTKIESPPPKPQKCQNRGKTHSSCIRRQSNETRKMPCCLNFSEDFRFSSKQITVRDNGPSNNRYII